MDGIGRQGRDPPRGRSAHWWVLTTADAAGTNGLTCISNYGGAQDNKFLVAHPMTDHCESNESLFTQHYKSDDSASIGPVFKEVSTTQQTIAKMEAHGALNTNIDKSKDLSMGLSNGPATAGVFVNGYKDGNPNALPRPTGDSYGAAGATIGLSGPPGGITATGTHIPNFGNQATLSANANIINTNDHKLGVNAFNTRVHPNGPTPNHSVHGGGVNYSYRDQVSAGASVARTPAAMMTQQSLSGSVNLHKTPTSSLDLNGYRSQIKTSHGNAPWQHGASITFRKQF
ncbi:hypothetical protein evm_009768 [Chilo suppressalis]|nr:hypothetical protein evm_009768 [Chilo suppressalis]